MLSKTAYFQPVESELCMILQRKSAKIFKQPIDFLTD